MRSSNTFNIEVVSIEKMSFHCAPSLRLLWVISGEITLDVIGGSINISSDEVEVININEPVQVSGTPGNEVILITIPQELCVEWDSDILYKNINIGITAFFMNVNFSKERRKKSVSSLKEKLKVLFLDFQEEYSREAERLLSSSHNYTVSNFRSEDSCREVFDFLIMNFDDIRENLYAIPGIQSRDAERFIQVDKYILQNISNKITLSDISSFTHITSTYLSAEFHAKFDQTFQSILSYYRTVLSVSLLLNSDYTISEIVEKSGFSSDKYFYKAIKTYLGCSPAAFRKANAIPHFKFTLLNTRLLLEDFLQVETQHFTINGLSEYAPGVKVLEGTDGDLYFIDGKCSFQVIATSYDNISIIQGTSIRIKSKESNNKSFLISNLSSVDVSTIFVKH